MSSTTTELATSAVGGSVDCAALAVATLALSGASGAAVVVGGGGGAGGVLSVSVLGAGGLAVMSPAAAADAWNPVAAPLPMGGGASVAVDVSDDVAHVLEVVGAVAVPPSVVLPDGATAPMAPGVHEMSVAAGDRTVAASVLTAVLVAAVVASALTAVLVTAVEVSVLTAVLVAAVEVSVLTAVLVAAVEVSVLAAVLVAAGEDDDGSVDEIELAGSGLLAVTSEGASDAPAVVSDVGVLPVVVVVPLAAETAVVSTEGTVVSTVWPGGAGTSPALAGATQVEVEVTPTIKTAIPRLSRSSRRR